MGRSCGTIIFAIMRWDVLRCSLRCFFKRGAGLENPPFSPQISTGMEPKIEVFQAARNDEMSNM